jgi:hypothetical protein
LLAVKKKKLLLQLLLLLLPPLLPLLPLLAQLPLLLAWQMLLPLLLPSNSIYLISKKPPSGGFFYVCNILRPSGYCFQIFI